MDSYSEVRRVRKQMSQQVGHDIRKLIASINGRWPEDAARVTDPGTQAEQCNAPKTSIAVVASDPSAPAAR
jgi:hypothetical protein